MTDNFLTYKESDTNLLKVSLLRIFLHSCTLLLAFLLGPVWTDDQLQSPFNSAGLVPYADHRREGDVVSCFCQRSGLRYLDPQNGFPRGHS